MGSQHFSCFAAAAGPVIEQATVGTDSRVAINDTRQYPYSAVGLIQVTSFFLGLHLLARYSPNVGLSETVGMESAVKCGCLLN